jgi:hypothetical protein
MTEETPGIEPPDPDPRNRRYELNGLGSPGRLFRFAENNEKGIVYRLKVGAIPKIPGQRIIFRYNETTNEYTCIKCNSVAVNLATSRVLWRDTRFNDPEIQCGNGPYCPHCEEYPKDGRLCPMLKRDLDAEVRAYEDAKRKGIQQII